MKFRLFSLRHTFFLIAVLFIFILLSAIIPQQDFAQEEILNWREALGDGYRVIEVLGLDAIYFTPTFFIVLGLLAINLVLSNIKRLKLVFQSRNRSARFRHGGSVIFHIALLIIIAGVVLNYLYKTDGVFALTEGQDVPDTKPAYFRLFEGPLSTPASDRFRLRLDKVHDDFPVAGGSTTAAEITLWPLTKQSPLTATIRTNGPLTWGELEFHFGMTTGYSPEVLVVDSLGNRLFRNFVRLSTRKVEGRTVYDDFVLVPEENLQINIEVRPGEDAPDATRFFVVVEDGHDPVYEGTLALTDTASFGDLRLTIPHLRRWCYVDVVESPFLNLVFVGFWTALAGLVVGFIPRLMGGRKH